MDEKEKVLYTGYIIVSTIILPLLLVGIYQSFLLSVILLVISISIAATKYYLYKIEEATLNKVAQFILSCVYGIWYLSGGKNQDSEQALLFDVSWAVFFSVISLLCLSFSWLIYITVIVCIGVLQTITKSSNS
jgi:hypothetical protein